MGKGKRTPLTAATVTAHHMDLILSDQKNDFKKRFGLGMSKICIRPQKFRDSKEMRRDLAHFLIYKDHGGKTYNFQLTRVYTYMYICVYIRIDIHIYRYIHIYTYTSIYTHIFICISIYLKRFHVIPTNFSYVHIYINK